MPMLVQQSASSLRMWLEIKIVFPIRRSSFSQRLEFQPGARVQPARWLVENQHRRIVYQRFLPGTAFASCRATSHSQNRRAYASDRAVPVRRQSLACVCCLVFDKRRRKNLKLPHLHPVVHAEIVGHVNPLPAARPADRALRCAPLPHHRRARPSQRSQEPDRRTLASAVGSNEPEQLPCPDVQIQALDRGKIAVSFAEVNEFDHEILSPSTGRILLGLQIGVRHFTRQWFHLFTLFPPARQCPDACSYPAAAGLPPTMGTASLPRPVCRHERFAMRAGSISNPANGRSTSASKRVSPWRQCFRLPNHCRHRLQVQCLTARYVGRLHLIRPLRGKRIGRQPAGTAISFCGRAAIANPSYLDGAICRAAQYAGALQIKIAAVTNRRSFRFGRRATRRCGNQFDRSRPR